MYRTVKTHELILKGIPDSHRAEIWLIYSGAINEVNGTLVTCVSPCFPSLLVFFLLSLVPCLFACLFSCSLACLPPFLRACLFSCLFHSFHSCFPLFVVVVVDDGGVFLFIYSD